MGLQKKRYRFRQFEGINNKTFNKYSPKRTMLSYVIRIWSDIRTPCVPQDKARFWRTELPLFTCFIVQETVRLPFTCPSSGLQCHVKPSALKMEAVSSPETLSKYTFTRHYTIHIFIDNTGIIGILFVHYRLVIPSFLKKYLSKTSRFWPLDGTSICP